MGYGAGYGAHAWGLGFPLWVAPVFTLLMVWALFWKGLALWHSAKRGQKWWFIILLLVNTAGLLEIAYLFFVAKLKLAELFGSEHTR